MGLSKSKQQQIKTAQPGFPNQSGFSSSPSQFPAQQPFQNSQPTSGFASQSGFPNSSQNSFPSQPNPFPSQPQGFNSQPPPFQSNQSGFPPFPAPPQQSLPGFPNNSLFNQPPIVASSGFPVSYPSQPFRPLIPGYAPAPSNDRRGGNPVAQEQQDSNDYSSRFYGEQQMSHLVQMPQMPIHSVKPRKH